VCWEELGKRGNGGRLQWQRAGLCSLWFLTKRERAAAVCERVRFGRRKGRTQEDGVRLATA